MIREANLGQVDFAAMREAMVLSQLRTSDVTDAAVIAAMSSVPREDFLPEDRRASAYIDRPVPLGNGRSINPPLATGRLLTIADIGEGDKVLLLGDATGYSAALLDTMGVDVTVVSEDERPEALQEGVAWVQGKGAEGYAAGAPYDAIVIDGVVPEFPAALTAQLPEGGHVALGLVERGVTRLVSGRKVNDVIGFVSLADMEMAEVPGFEVKRPEFQF